MRILWACIFLLGIAPTIALAQAQSSSQGQLTPEQRRILQRLPPGQREALLERLGIDPDKIEQEGLEFPETVLPAEDLEGKRAEKAEEEGEPRLEGFSTIIVRLEIPKDSDPIELRELETLIEEDELLQRFLGANTFQLDKDGVLSFPGITRMRLAGLTVEEAAARITAEAPFQGFAAEVVLLPLTATGKAALEPFGYLLFKGVPVTFAPATDVPVPSDYVIGPGDEIKVQLFGSENAEYSLIVNRDGIVNFPEIGPISVAGLSFDDVRDMLQTRIQEQMIGVRASITMGELRSIRVFVLGDVNRPGSFTVGGLSTMTNALFVSGGVAPIGSLRNVQLKRGGKIIRTLDLYDLMLRGDNSGDTRLQPGDVIFVPPIGPTVGVAGEVRRPAIYETKGSTSVGEMIAMAGGLTPEAYPSAIRIERVESGDRRALLTVDLSREDSSRARVENGDVLYVDALSDEFDGSVNLTGHVYRPGNFQWFAGMRIANLIPSAAHLKPDADRAYVLVRRELERGGTVEILSADLMAAWREPDGSENIALRPRDRVFVFDLTSGRAAILEPLLEEVRRQAVYAAPSREVEIGGNVRAPGTYPLEPGMRVSDLIRAGANLSESAYALEAELTRYRIDDGTVRVTELVDVDLQAVMAGDASADVLLQPFDYLNIKEVSLWREQGTVEILGEVRFPGEFPIEIGETLTSVIERAGGLTEFAFSDGSVFLREELKEREREQLQRLALRLENDLTALTLQAARAEVGIDQSLSVGQSLLTQLRTAEPLGRLVIDLRAALQGNESQDVILEDGDRLIIPGLTQEVTVIGEVQYSTSHIHNRGLARSDYISLSGGYTANADKRRVYVVRANGAVVAGGSSRWFRAGERQEIRPGDTIVVPLDVDRVPKLALWQSSTTIIYNLAIAAAAVSSL